MLPCFCKNQRGFDSVGYLFRQTPKIQGKSVLSLLETVNCRYSPEIVEPVQMNIPEQHLLRLTELLSGKPAQDPKEPFSQDNGYKINTQDWSCVLSEPGNEPWYFRPLAATLCDSKSDFGDSKTILNPWTINQRLSEAARKSIQVIDDGQRVEDLAGNFFVITSESFGAVLSARCTSLQLVAKAIETWGNPPGSVIQDWQYQLEKSTLPSTAETLVTEDGILIPLSDMLNQLARSGLDATDVAVKPLSQTAPFSSPAPDWPHCKPSLKSLVDSDPVAPSLYLGHSAGRLNRKRSTISKWLPMVSVAAAITIMALTISLLSPDKRNPDEMVAGSEVPKTQTTSLKKMAAGNDAGTDNDVTETKLQELTITSDPTALNTEASVQQSELTIEKLLAQLRPNKESALSLDSISASSIISEALPPAEMGLPAISADGTPGGDIQSSEASVPAALKTVLSESGRITLERPLRLRAAITKETVSVGKPVLAKACICEIELKLAENLVVEPMESVTIEGTGKASWRIAMEDEDPELVVEIWSKPGAKWQIIIAVGLREEPGAIPIWIGPREAQNVGNRLIDYRQWINNAIDTLRTARSNSRGRSAIDFSGEIKKLERQEREAEKAIERWKVIARLSHFFFDSNEVRIQLTAVEKP